jgi:DNA-directed RNA polymerase specialized sigma24 family protein
MEAAAATATSPNDELLALRRYEHRQALLSLCQPHWAGLFDFALRVVRDRAVAAMVVRKTFEKAASAEDMPTDVRPWIYTLARSFALDGLRYRRRPSRWIEETREGLDFTSIDAGRLSNPSAVLFDKQLIELVWETAASMDLEDYSLLDLHLRRGLSARVLAEHLGAKVNVSASKIADLRDSFEDSVRAVLLATRVRRSCAGLDSALSGLGADAASTEVRRAVQRHLKDCEACRQSSRGLVSPAEVLAGFAPMPPPAGLQEEVVGRPAANDHDRVSSNRLRWVFFRHSVPAPGG